MSTKRFYLLMGLLLSGGLQAETLSGKLHWADEVHYAFPVNGVVEQLGVVPGERVKKSQLLAQLEQAPFAIKVQKMQARIAQLEPRLFDARLELDRAKELFDRTVLSEIELQKIETVYKGLLAEKSAATADLKLARYEQKKSRLQAGFSGRVVDVAMQQGDVISAYNRDRKIIRLVSDSAMLAVADISAETAAAIDARKNFRVQLEGNTYTASWYALSPSSQAGHYQLKVKFSQPGAGYLAAGMDVDIHYGE